MMGIDAARAGDGVVSSAKSKKKEVNRSIKAELFRSFTDTEMARKVIDHTNPRTELKIYDGQFKLVEHITPKCTEATLKKGGCPSSRCSALKTTGGR